MATASGGLTDSLLPETLHSGQPLLILITSSATETECSNRTTVLFEYLDHALATRSWISHYDSMAFTPILLYYPNGLSMMITPSTYWLSAHSSKWFTW